MVDFGLPKSTPQFLVGVRKSIFCVFFARARSGALPGLIWASPETLPARISGGFPEEFRTFPPVSDRGSPGLLGCCRDAPSHSGTSSPGCFWGTTISHSELNSPYPTGVLACQTQFGLPPVPEGVPLLTSPPGPARPSNPLPRRVPGALFQTFSVFFGVPKNGEKTDDQKIDFFR